MVKVAICGKMQIWGFGGVKYFLPFEAVFLRFERITPKKCVGLLHMCEIFCNFATSNVRVRTFDA